MKATKVYYQKCFNLGNYQNEVIGIELEVEEGENALDVIEKAKKFVNEKSSHNAGNDERNRYLEVIKNAQSYSGITVKEALGRLCKTQINNIWKLKFKKTQRKWKN